MNKQNAMRAIIYARYSSENQREESIDDQVEICRRYIEARGWKLTQVYSDRAISGASRHRAGYQQMIADAEQRSFDIIVSEALDRIGRKLSDVADLHDRLQFLGIPLHAVKLGEITTLLSASWARWRSFTFPTCATRQSVVNWGGRLPAKSLEAMLTVTPS